MKEQAHADRINCMSTKDLVIAIVLMLVCVFGFKPALNNFKVVLHDKSNPKVTPGMRRFVLMWLGLGVVCAVLLFFVMAYSIAARFGILPDFSF